MSPSQLKKLSELYREKNSEKKKIENKINEIDIKKKIENLIKKEKQDIEKCIIKSVKDGKTEVFYYDYYVVQTFLANESMREIEKAAYRYMTKAVEAKNSRVGDIELCSKIAASIFALISFMNDGFEVYQDKLYKSCKNWGLIKDW